MSTNDLALMLVASAAIVMGCDGILDAQRQAPSMVPAPTPPISAPDPDPDPPPPPVGPPVRTPPPVLPPMEDVCAGAPTAGATPLRRLTRHEYAHSVEALFGLHVDTSSLPADEDLSGFYDNSNQSVLAAGAQAYLRTSEDLFAQLRAQLERFDAPLRLEAEAGRHSFEVTAQGFVAMSDDRELDVELAIAAPGRYEVALRAYQSAGDSAPVRAQIRLDDQLIATVEVEGDAVDPEVAYVRIEATRVGRHTLSLQKLEGARELHVDYVELRPLHADKPAWLDCASGAVARDCALDTLEAVAASLWRRPLRDDDRARLAELYDMRATDDSPEAALATVATALLNSGAFLYRLEPALASPVLGDDALAERLAMFLWRSSPDAALMAAAAAGELSSPEGLEAEARRMLDDRRARRTIHEFFAQWIGLHHSSLTKTKGFADLYTAEVRRAQREELDRFVDLIFDKRQGSLEALLTEPVGFVDRHNAFIYGLALEEARAEEVALDGQRRAGLLTLPIFLASHSNGATSSPLHRGYWLRERLLCDPVGSPPDGVESMLKPPPAGRPESTRMKSQRTIDSGGSCAYCHMRMDAMGFALENFDTIGRWREREEVEYPPGSGSYVALDVDGSGVLQIGTEATPVTGPVALAKVLSTHDRVRQCMTKEWFRFALGRYETPLDACSLAQAAEAFERSGWDMRELIIGIVLSDAFALGRTTTTTDQGE